MNRQVLPDHHVETAITESAKRGRNYTSGFRTARVGGRRAHGRGIAIWANPYVGEKAAWWRRGWIEARDELDTAPDEAQNGR